MSNKKRFRFRYVLLLLVIVGALVSSNYIPLKEVVVLGTNRKKEVLKKAGIKSKKLYRCKSSEIAKRIRKLNWVYRIGIRKFPWGVLAISIIERKPVGYLVENNRIYGVDLECKFFPISDTVGIQKFLGDRDYVMNGVRLLEILRYFKGTLILSKMGPITSTGRLKVLWGVDNYRKKLKILKDLKALGYTKGQIDMRFKGLVVYREEVKIDKG